MKRYSAPGLPPQPPLLFDAPKRRAKVTARHATWQSEEWARRATVVVGWTTVGVLLWRLWVGLAPMPPLPRGLVLLLAYAVGSPIIRGLITATLHPFLARQVFAKRTTLWVTPEAVAIRSHLYRRPVMIWRRWEDAPVGIRFIAGENQRAAQYASHLKYEKRATRPYLEEAALLQMVLTSISPLSGSAAEGQDGSLRAIPITDIHQRMATRFTMVYAAALALTARTAEPEPVRYGVDIESV